MTIAIDIAEKELLLPQGLDSQQLIEILGDSEIKRADSADIYLQSRQQESWGLEEGIVKEGSFSIDKGFGIRVLMGDKTGFAYADDIQLKAIRQGFEAAAGIIKYGNSAEVKIETAAPGLSLYPSINPLISISEQQKIQILHEVDQYARQLDTSVKQVNANLNAEYNVVLMIDNSGQCIADVRPLVQLHVSVIVEKDGKREQGFSGGGARSDYHYLLSVISPCERVDLAHKDVVCKRSY